MSSHMYPEVLALVDMDFFAAETWERKDILRIIAVSKRMRALMEASERYKEEKKRYQMRLWIRSQPKEPRAWPRVRSWSSFDTETSGKS